MKKLITKLLKWRENRPQEKSIAKGAATPPHEAALRHAETWRRSSDAKATVEKVASREAAPTGQSAKRDIDASADKPERPRAGKQQKRMQGKARAEKARGAGERRAKDRQQQRRGGDAVAPRGKPAGAELLKFKAAPGTKEAKTSAKPRKINTRLRKEQRVAADARPMLGNRIREAKTSAKPRKMNTRLRKEQRVAADARPMLGNTIRDAKPAGTRKRVKKGLLHKF
jgi:hypothetical protein